MMPERCDRAMTETPTEPIAAVNGNITRSDFVILFPVEPVLENTPEQAHDPDHCCHESRQWGIQ